RNNNSDSLVKLDVSKLKNIKEFQLENLEECFNQTHILDFKVTTDFIFLIVEHNNELSLYVQHLMTKRPAWKKSKFNFKRPVEKILEYKIVWSNYHEIVVLVTYETLYKTFQIFRLNEPIDFISFSELGEVFMVNKRVNQTKKTYVYNKNSKWTPVQLNQLKDFSLDLQNRFCYSYKNPQGYLNDAKYPDFSLATAWNRHENESNLVFYDGSKWT
ncbi:unnamed protein product, partial [Brachionus calyciflorus]